MFSRTVFTTCCALVVLFGAARSSSAQQISLYDTKYDVYRTVIDNQWKVEVEWTNGESTTYGPFAQVTAFDLFGGLLGHPNVASVELIPAFTSETEYLGRFDTEAQAEAAQAEAEAMSDTGVVWILEVHVPRTFMFYNAISNYNLLSRYFQTR